MKILLIGCFYLFLVIVLTACGSGEVIEWSPDDVKVFAENEKSGFIYVKSAVSTGQEQDEMIIREIKDTSENKNIDFYIFNPFTHEKFISELGIDLYAQYLGFYQDGEKKSEIDLSGIDDRDNIAGEITRFIENINRDYLE